MKTDCHAEGCGLVVRDVDMWYYQAVERLSITHLEPTVEEGVRHVEHRLVG